AGVRTGNGLVTITYAGTIAPPPPPPKVPTGQVFCSVTGTITFKKPLTNTPSAKTVALKTVLAGTCDHSQVVGGKAPITDVAATEPDTLLAGATCSDIFAPTKPGKISVKWQARKPTTNKLFTVASNTAANLGVQGAARSVLTSATAPIAKPKTAAFFGD